MSVFEIEESFDMLWPHWSFSFQQRVGIKPIKSQNEILLRNPIIFVLFFKNWFKAIIKEIEVMGIMFRYHPVTSFCFRNSQFLFSKRPILLKHPITKEDSHCVLPELPETPRVAVNYVAVEEPDAVFWSFRLWRSGCFVFEDVWLNHFGDYTHWFLRCCLKFLDSLNIHFFYTLSPIFRKRNMAILTR